MVGPEDRQGGTFKKKVGTLGCSFRWKRPQIFLWRMPTRGSGSQTNSILIFVVLKHVFAVQSCNSRF